MILFIGGLIVLTVLTTHIFWEFRKSFNPILATTANDFSTSCFRYFTPYAVLYWCQIHVPGPIFVSSGCFNTLFHNICPSSYILLNWCQLHILGLMLVYSFCSWYVIKVI